MLSDDNVLSNPTKFRELCKNISEWQKEHGYPFELWVQCSINIADSLENQEALLAANARSLFIGVESVSDQVLKSVGKHVNIQGNIKEKLDILVKAGFDIMTGMIVGFDDENETVFDDIISFVENTRIPLAYVQVLQGLEGTPLINRLRKDERIRLGLGQYSIGTARTNVITVMDPRNVQQGYRKILESIYDYGTCYERAKDFILKMNERNIEFKPSKYTRLSLFHWPVYCYLLSTFQKS